MCDNFSPDLVVLPQAFLSLSPLAGIISNSRWALGAEGQPPAGEWWGDKALCPRCPLVRTGQGALGKWGAGSGTVSQAVVTLREHGVEQFSTCLHVSFTLATWKNAAVGCPAPRRVDARRFSVCPGFQNVWMFLCYFFCVPSLESQWYRQLGQLWVVMFTCPKPFNIFFPGNLIFLNSFIIWVEIIN